MYHELQHFSELLLKLHEGALEPDRWSEFLGLLGRRLKANYVTLMLRSPAIGECGLLYTWGASVEGTAAYTDRYFALDPFVQLPEGQLVTLHEFVGRERLEASEFYRDYLVPLDAIYNLGVDLREPGRYAVRFRVNRAARTGEFSVSARRLCGLLVPHLRVAIRTHLELDLVRTERGIYADAMTDLTLGAIFLDENARVVHGNALARQILAEQDGISLADGTLVFRSPEDASRYEAAFARALESGRTGRPGLVEAIRVRRPSGKGRSHRHDHPPGLAADARTGFTGERRGGGVPERRIRIARDIDGKRAPAVRPHGKRSATGALARQWPDNPGGRRRTRHEHQYRAHASALDLHQDRHLPADRARADAPAQCCRARLTRPRRLIHHG
ncbi:MAG: hypothetical protein R3E69_15085 [Steroidobacteraceae bacterium]